MHQLWILGMLLSAAESANGMIRNPLAASSGTVPEVQVTTVVKGKGKTMADRKECAYYGNCPYWERFEICPAWCMKYKHRDNVHVVRCKDCKHMEVTPDHLRWCNAWNGINGMGDDGFCNYGEREEQ